MPHLNGLLHFVDHRPHFVNLVGFVQGLVRLIGQVQEAPKGKEAVVFHDFPQSGGVCDKVVAAPLPIALIPLLDHALDLLGSQVCLVTQEPPEISVEEQLEKEKHGALVVDVVRDVLGAYVVSKELCVYPGDSLCAACAKNLGRGFPWLRVTRF